MSFPAGSEGSNPGTPHTSPGSPTSQGIQPSVPVLQTAHGSQAPHQSSAPVLQAAQGRQASQSVPTINVHAIAQSLANVISQAVASSTAPAPPVPVTNPLLPPAAPALHPSLPPRGSSIPKINDLPNFKGFGIDGADATSFLPTLQLEDLFDLHQVQSAHRVI
jgi:hypothetical protein